MARDDRRVLPRCGRSASLWPNRSRSNLAHAPRRPTPPLEESTHGRRRASIGAGYAGLSTALHLAERGVKTVVLEAHEPGWGGSGRNGGQVIPGLKYDPDELVEKFGRSAASELVAFAGRPPTRCST